ncbi:MAG TPA: metalloregulator ArsR/SmtB family transcription factor [Acidimicrobiales bacterium]|nr:metalloregulator ArsR/SmtB family transcription factor [Acidimicrobiales bacterium]
MPSTTAVGDDVVDLLQALANPSRLRLFTALRARERCVRDLVDETGLSQPLVSHHLAVLAQVGLVRSRRSDGFTLYALDPDGLAGAAAAVAVLLDPATLEGVAMPGGNAGCCRAGDG